MVIDCNGIQWDLMELTRSSAPWLAGKYQPFNLDWWATFARFQRDLAAQIWGFHKWGTQSLGWFGKILLKWMIWMYTYVRKPIFSNVFSNNWLNRSRFVFRVDIVHPSEWDGWRNHKQAVCIQHPSMNWIRFKNSDPASNRFWTMHTISSSMFLAKNDPYPSYFNPWQVGRTLFNKFAYPIWMSISVTVTAFDLWDVWYIPAIPSHGLLKVYCLVVWNIWIMIPYIGNNDPNWLICFRGVENGWNHHPV